MSNEPEILRECSPPSMCHMSHFTCCASHVPIFVFSFSFLGQNVGASQWRVCYQRGLPRLVLKGLLKDYFYLFVYPLPMLCFHSQNMSF